MCDDTSLIPGATEEFLRYWALVSTCREAKVDVEFHGATIQAGDLVNICTPAASRDPKEFDNPDDIDFRRTANRHLAFGAGPHRCIGSHLARMEVSVVLEETMRLMPDFALDPANPPAHRFGQVIGVDVLPLVVKGSSRRDDRIRRRRSSSTSTSAKDTVGATGCSLTCSLRRTMTAGPRCLSAMWTARSTPTRRAPSASA